MPEATNRKFAVGDRVTWTRVIHSGHSIHFKLCKGKVLSVDQDGNAVQVKRIGGRADVLFVKSFNLRFENEPNTLTEALFPEMAGKKENGQ